MAKQVMTTLVDDIDGGIEGVETFQIGYKGANYEIDLGGANAEALLAQLNLVTERGRKVNAAAKPKAQSQAGRVRDPETAAAREWALANGRMTSTRGRVPAAVLDEYRAATKQQAGLKLAI